MYRVLAITTPAGSLKQMVGEPVVVYQYENPPEGYVGPMHFTRALSDFELRMIEA